MTIAGSRGFGRSTRVLRLTASRTASLCRRRATDPARSRAIGREVELERETGFEPVAAEFKTGRLYSGSAHRRARTGIQMHPRWVSVGVSRSTLTLRLQESSATRQASTIRSGELAMFDHDPIVQ